MEKEEYIHIFVSEYSRLAHKHSEALEIIREQQNIAINLTNQMGKMYFNLTKILSKDEIEKVMREIEKMQ